MGARGQVSIKYDDNTKVYLYTHWGVGELKADVQKALARKQRWDDEEYLTRIIFDAMKGEDITGETGFGIGTSEHEDIELLVQIEPGQKVRIGDMVWTFDEYLLQTID